MSSSFRLSAATEARNSTTSLRSSSSPPRSETSGSAKRPRRVRLRVAVGIFDQWTTGSRRGCGRCFLLLHKKKKKKRF